MAMAKIETLIIPAAGAGTRLRPATYATPKELLRLVDKPIVYYLLAETYQAGIRHVVFITHSDNRLTKEFFESSRAEPLLANMPDLTVTFVETNERSGDGQALLETEALVQDGPFAVSMGDMLTLPGESILAELALDFGVTGESVISVEEIPNEKTGQYGVIDSASSEGNRYRVRGIVEKPAPKDAPSNFAMTGKYILYPEIFSYLHKCRDATEGELKLAHALDAYAKEHPLAALAARTQHWDIGTKADLLKAEITFSLAHPELKEAARELLKKFLR